MTLSLPNCLALPRSGGAIAGVPGANRPIRATQSAVVGPLSMIRAAQVVQQLEENHAASAFIPSAVRAAIATAPVAATSEVPSATTPTTADAGVGALTVEQEAAARATPGVLASQVVAAIQAAPDAASAPAVVVGQKTSQGNDSVAVFQSGVGVTPLNAWCNDRMFRGIIAVGTF